MVHKQAKQDLRRVVKAALRARGAALVKDGEDVSTHLAPLLPSTGPKRSTVALFASRDSELSTTPLDALLRARSLTRALPRIVEARASGPTINVEARASGPTINAGDQLEFVIVDDDTAIADLPRDALGIPTPTGDDVIALVDCALVVVPGLAFDARGGRLGYGKGYYDRALNGVDDDVIVGVLSDCQWVDAVPMEAHDRRLRRLVSPRGVHMTQAR